MAVIAYTEVDTQWKGMPAHLYEWALLTQASSDTGKPIRLPAHSDVSVQIVSGTLGTGGTITWQGTLDDATTPTQYGTLHKPDMTNLTQAAIGAINQVLEHPLQYRPNCTAGDGTTSLTVRLLALNQMRS